jgi:hypothetical protein
MSDQRFQLNSFPPPRKVSLWGRLFRKEGDVWEQRINEWGVWDKDALRRWEWDGKEWVEVPTV